MKKILVKISVSIFCITSIARVYAEDGLNLEMAFFKLNKEVKVLNEKILTLKEDNERIREGQRLNNEKISELFEILELKLTESKKEKVILKSDEEKKAFKLYSDGRSQFVGGNYNIAINSLKSYLATFPYAANIEDSKLWLGRAYFANESYLKSKSAFISFQFNGEVSHNQDHPKYADSLYELSRVLIELKETNDAKLLLSKMIKEYPDHALLNKAVQLLEKL